MNSEDGAVLDATRALIERARQQGAPGYAAGWIPVGTRDLSALLVATRTQLVERRFVSRATGMALPAGAGEHVILLDAGAARADAMFTVRHEMAHILAREVSEALFLTSEDTMSFSERRADLFAVADLTPSRWMQRYTSRRPARNAAIAVVQAYREMTHGWSDARLWDRARLRLLLYGQCHV